MKRPKIHEIATVPEFFKEWFLFLKSVESRWSLRKLADETQLSLGYLSSLQNGKIKTSKKALEKLIPALKLLPSEASFLKNWILATQNKIPLDQSKALKSLERFRGYKEKFPAEIEAYRYLSHWYYIAIREMADLPDFNVEPSWIQQRLLWKVPLVNIERALKFLVKNKFIEFDEQKKVIRPDKTLNCSQGVFRVALGNMHQEMITRAQSALLKVNEKKRYFDGYSVALSASDYKKAKDILAKALDEISGMVQSSDPGDEVYHLELMLFPLSQKKDERE